MATISTNDIKIRYDIDLTKLQQATEQFDKITAEERAMLRELGKLKKQLDEAAESAKKFGKNTDDSFSNANNGIKTMTSSATKMVGLLGGIFVVSQIKQFASAVVETTIKFESMRKAIDFASGSMEAGAKNFQFITDLANRLGLDLKGTAEGYKTFASASNLAGQSSQETNRQFAAVAKAAQVMGLSAEDTKGAFLALGQMMSKGNVQAEELRGQLGERLVGAFGIAAKAMGVTTAELNKMLQKGQVLSSEFLPKFATELENTFGKGNTQVTSLAASQNRFNSSIDQLILAIGNKLNPFLKGAYDLAAGIASALNNAGQQSAAEKRANFDAEAVASKRIQIELAKETFKLDQQNQVKITAFNIEGIRKQIARNQLMGMEEKINAQMVKVQNSRIAAAGSFNNKLKSNLKDQENELAVLKAQEDQYAKIAGAIINTPPPPPPIDEKAAKAAQKFEEEQYARKLQLLRLTRELAQLNIKINFDNKIDILREEYKAEKKYLNDAYNLQVEYSAKGVQAATDAIKVTDKERTLNRVETIRGLKDETQTTLDSINKQRAENNKFDTERGKAQDDRKFKKSKLDQDLFELDLKHQEKMDDLDKQFAEERKNRRKQELEDEDDIRQKKFEIAQTIAEAGFNIYQANLNNELTLLNKKYNEEVRLADGNKQKLAELEQNKEAKERELKLKQFRADQAAAIARVIFATAEKLMESALNPALIPYIVGLSAFQIGAIAAQPVPEFAEGTKGKPFQGGKAIVGERGVEKVVTESGKVYFTPPTATLVDLPKGSQVIPNHALSKQEIYWGSMQSGRQSSSGSPMIGKLDELGSILKGLPITQLNMDERGFEKFIRTPRRTTKILNNRFRTEN
jgi:tape measure domain-containing protein